MADSKKILVITSTYPRHDNDYAVPWMRETHRRLKERGHQVVVLAPAFRGLRSHSIDGIEVSRFRYAPKRIEMLTHEEGASYKVRSAVLQLLAIPYVLLGCLAAIRLAYTRKFDVIHVHWPFPHGLMGQAAKRFGGGALVMMSHGAEFSLSRRKRWITPFLRQSLRAADVRVANSRDTRNRVEDCCGLPCSVLPYGTTVSVASTASSVNAIPRVLFTGRLIERKGVEYLLQAIPIILDHHAASFVITGDGDQREKLEALCKSLAIDEHVEFLGFVSTAELADQYQRCDIWVNPGVIDSWGDAEGLGVGSIEAYSYFKPVVASNVGGIPDTVIDGKTGRLVPQRDPLALAKAISELIASPEKRTKFGRAGFAFASEAFSWDRIIPRLERHYRDAQESRNASLLAEPSDVRKAA